MERAEERKVLELVGLPPNAREVIGLIFQKFPSLRELSFKTLIGSRVAAYFPPTEKEKGYIGINEHFMHLVETIGMTGEAALPLRERTCANLGIDPKELTPELVGLFIIVHELGHAYHMRGMDRAQAATFREQLDAAFYERYRAHNMAEFLSQHPTATRTEQLNFARAYRNRPTEARADSLACEMLQSIKRRNPDLLPSISKTTKNYT